MPNWLLCVYLIHTASAIDVAMVTNDHGDELVDHLMEPGSLLLTVTGGREKTGTPSNS